MSKPASPIYERPAEILQNLIRFDTPTRPVTSGRASKYMTFC